MVHKKYTYKDGKKYGPYLYETKRVDGKIVTKYIGPSENNLRVKKFVLPVAFFSVFAVLLLIFIFYPLFTGNVILNIKTNYKSGEQIQGDLILKLKAGELLPADSVISLTLNNVEEQSVLRDLIDESIISGNFYAEGKSLQGSGEGYGLIGLKKDYPEISFQLEIVDKLKESDSSGSNPDSSSSLDDKTSDSADSGESKDLDNEGSENKVVDDKKVDNSQETQSKEGESNNKQSIPDSSQPESSESTSEGNSDSVNSDSSSSGDNSGSLSAGESAGAGITGGVVFNPISSIQGEVSKGNDFVYSLNEEQNARIIPGSVYVNGKNIEDNFVNLNIKGKEAVVSTTYYSEEEGFGEDYLGKDFISLSVSLEKFNLTAEQGVIYARVVFDDESIVEVSKNIFVDSSYELDKGINKSNNDDSGDYSTELNNTSVSILNRTGINNTEDNNTNSSDEYIIDVPINVTKPDILNNFTFTNRTNVSVITSNEQIVIGKPVRWVKKIDAEGPIKINIEIPISADNFTIIKIDKDKVEFDDSLNEIIIDENGNSSGNNGLFIDEKMGENGSMIESNKQITDNHSQEIEEVEVDINGGIITGAVTASLNLDKESNFVLWLKNVFGRMTGFVSFNGVIEEPLTKEISIGINQSEKGAELEYYTPAPYTIEENTNNGKRVTIIGPDDVHYEDVLSYAYLDGYSNIDSSKIKIFWEENLSYVEPTNVTDSENGTYIEWITPSLSNQTFNIIVITNAEHLDENRIFISNIYEEVKALDGNWSETINDNEYVRVVFERNLTSENDITIYPRNVSGTNMSDVKIEVYEADGDEIIASFENITSENYNKIFLDGSSGFGLPWGYSQDTFDLRVIDGSVEFDHIVDPLGCGDLAGTYVKEINISNTNVDTNLTNFPVLISFSGDSDINSHALSNGYDIRFINSSGDELSYDRDFFNGTDGDFWVKVPLVDADAVTTIYMHYGNKTAVCDGEDAGNVWTTNFQAVYHLKESASGTGNADVYKDSTSNAYHADDYVSGTGNTGIVNNGTDFDGADDTVRTGLSAEVNDLFADSTAPSNTWSVSAWFIAPTETTADEVIVGRGGGTGTSATYGLYIESSQSDKLSTVIRGKYTYFSAADIDDGIWHHAATTWNGTTGKIYLDGVEYAMNIGTKTKQSNTIMIGATSSGTSGDYSGSIDEVRLSNVTLPFEWYKFEYYNINEADNELTFGSEETVRDTSAPNVTINFPKNITYFSAFDLPLNFNVSLNENGSVLYSLDDGINNISMLSYDEDSLFGMEFNSTNDTLVDGNHTFRVFANDTAGNNNYSASVFFTLVTEIIINSTVTNSTDDPINTTLLVYDESEAYYRYNRTGRNHNFTLPLNDIYTIEFTPVDIHSINKFALHNLNFSATGKREIDIISIGEYTDKNNFTNVFAIDPQIQNFSNVSITFTASGDSLFKCSEWNITLGICSGNWSLAMNDLIVGQTYNVSFDSGIPGYGMINITNATHLDENRSFISNIFNETKELDDIWSETIPNGHFVRVTFEQNLTSENDITIYPRNVSGTNMSDVIINVYEVNNDTDVIAQFTDINEEDYNRILLDGSTGIGLGGRTQDTFDLQILNGSLEFDHILDPTIIINGPIGDIGLSPIDNETFALIFVNITANTIQLAVINTNGSTKLAPITIASSGVNYNFSRVAITSINSTDVFIGFTNGTVDNRVRYNINGDKIAGPFSGDGALGANVHDVGVTAMGAEGRVAYCYVDLTEGDADIRLYWYNLSISAFGEDNANPAIAPVSPMNQLIDCVAINQTDVFLFEYDAGNDDDATFHIESLNATFGLQERVTDKDIDVSVGDSGQVALTSLNQNSSAMVWYNSSDIGYAVRSGINSVIKPGTRLDFVGTYSRVDIATVHNLSDASNPAARDYFVIAWYNQLSGELLGQTFTDGGANVTNVPFVIDSSFGASNATSLFALVGEEDASGLSICPGKWAIAYTNSTNNSVIKTYNLVGDIWDGVCETVGDTSAPNVTINFPKNITYGPIDLPLYFSVTLDEIASLVQYSLDNGVNNVTLNSLGELNYGGSNSSIADGGYTFRVFANDTAGNNNYSASVNFSFFNKAPYTIINSPLNRSIFSLGISNITLNTTIYDDGNNINVSIYGVNSTSTDNFYKHGLLYRGSVPNGTIIVYNWTSPVLIPDSSTLILLHLDNRSEYGENGTFAYDYSNNGNNASQHGNVAPNESDGKFAGGWRFYGGSNNWLNASVPSQLVFDNSGTYTWTAWVKLVQTGVDNGLFFKGSFAESTGFLLLIEDDNTVSIAKPIGTGDNSNNQLSTTDTLSADRYYHLAFTYNTDSDMKIYIDGQLKASGSGVFSDGTVDHELQIGRAMNGTLDEVAIWNRALNGTEIQNLYQLNRDKYYWKVNTSDSINYNESSTNEFVIRNNQFLVNESLDCAGLAYNALNLYYGYNYTDTCKALDSSLTQCTALNTDINISQLGRLNLHNTCGLYFNASSTGALALFLESELNMSGAIISTTSSLARFNLSVIGATTKFIDSIGNISYANIVNPTNISDSRIFFSSINISNQVNLLNSTDLSSYTIDPLGFLDRQFRLHVIVADDSASFISGANVTARNNTNGVAFSLLTDGIGIVNYNLTQYRDEGNGKAYWNNYTLNHSKSGYLRANVTSLNLTNDTTLVLTLNLFSNIIVNNTETLHDIYTRIGDENFFNNLSSGTNCRYVAKATINITTGNLVMEGCTLEINNSDFDGNYNLYVSRDGTVTANNSNFSRSTATEQYNYGFSFFDGSKAILKNSYLTFTGEIDSLGRRGLLLNTTNVTFVNNTLFGGYDANLEINSGNITLLNSKFKGGATTTYNIYCQYCGDVSIVDSNLSNSITSDVVLLGNQSLHLVNTSYTTYSTQLGAFLFNKWYVGINVTNTLGAGIAGVNVSFFNSSNTFIDSAFTNLSGQFRANISEYVIYGDELGSGVKVYHNNYTVNTSKIGYSLEEKSLNVSTNRVLDFTTLTNPFSNFVLNSPLNNSVYRPGVMNLTLNVTFIDDYLDIMDVKFYGVNSTSTDNFYKHGLLYRNDNALNGTLVAYNWTSPVIVPDASTVFLLHLDNRSEYGENNTNVYDSSDRGNNGTLVNHIRFNNSGGKFGGGVSSPGIAYGDYITFPDSPILNVSNVTIMAWIYPYLAGSEGFIVSKDNETVSGPDGIWFMFDYIENMTKFDTGADSPVNSSANVITKNNWTHVAVTANQSTIIFYVNGINVGSNIGTYSLRSNFNTLVVGSTIRNTGYIDSAGGFNGTLDEIVIWNRTLTADEINSTYFLDAGNYYWKVNVSDNGNNLNESETRTIGLSSTDNLAPNNPLVELNSTLATNRTAQDLNCYSTISDPDGDTLNVMVEWFNNSILHTTLDYNNSYANNSLFVATLDFANTTKNENWTCGLKLYDGLLYSNKINSTNNLTILNTPPTIPSLSSPSQGSSTTDRTPTFSWSASTDDDSDSLTYELNISCSNTLGGGCSGYGSDERHTTGIVSTSYELISDLVYLYDNGYNYNWSLRAYDSEDFSAWSSFRTINISALIEISLPNSTVSFGNIAQFGANDTTDDSPKPFLIQNDGNSFVNVTIAATDLWRSQENPSNYYSFKIDNPPLENGSFNWVLSKSSYTQIPNLLSPILAIARLNYTNVTDTAEIDINVTVPDIEPAGIRNSTVTFTASLGE